MRDRRTHRVLADIAALRIAERTAAHQDWADARSREREAEDAARRADMRTVAAAQAWDMHLAGTFAPELARALADELISYGKAAAVAHDHRARLEEAGGDAERAWYDSDARCRLTERALEDSGRAMRRDREERALAALADRVTLRWRRA